jgi:multiple sugar transport system substrate-binding protein
VAPESDDFCHYIESNSTHKEEYLMKQLKYILFILIIFSVLLASCGTPTPEVAEIDAEPAASNTTSDTTDVEPASEKAEPVVLTIMHDWEPTAAGTHTVLADIIEEFSAEYPHIKIVQEIFDTMSIPTKVDTSFLAGKEPDIVFMNQFNNTRIWLDNGVTVPVQDYLEEWGMADNYFLPSAIKSYSTESGDLRAFPLEGFIWPIFYRADLFEAAGIEIPQTQEELIAAAFPLRDAGYQPFVVGGSDWTGFNFLMLQMQGCMEDEEGLDLATNGGWAANANAQKCADLFVQMRDAGVFSHGAEGLEFSTMVAEFTAGKAAMMMTGSWSFVDIPEEMRDDIVVMGFPVPEQSVQEKPVYYSSFNAKGVWITRNGAMKIEPAGLFISYLYKPENIARFVEAGMVSPLLSVPVDESKINPLFVKGFELAETSHVLGQPQDFFPPEIFGEVERVLRQAYIPDGMTSTNILEALDALY